MTQPIEKDYVLGTDDEELQRLGLQHRVWRETVLNCWQSAGLAAGANALDVGAGPGFATSDLAGIVGPEGSVTALERSNRFIEAGKNLCARRGLENVHWHELDLMTDAWPAANVDFAWCRWVACFVSSPELLVSKLAGALRPGGVAVFHEYVHYETWRLAPRVPSHEEFVQQVMASWRATGGEPDIAAALPGLLAAHGFKIRSAEPKIFCARPGDELWQWPASFIHINLKRLVQLGRVAESWAERVRRDFAAATANPNSLIFTPMVLQIVAERE